MADYVAFLQWQEHQTHKPEFKSWSFGFIENFNSATIRTTDNPNGMDVKMAAAEVGRRRRAAMWAHPPVVGQTVIEFLVPIPQEVDQLKLHVSIGIRDGANIAEDNLVAFIIRVNGIRVWGQQTNHQIWQEFQIPLDLPSGDIIQLEFATEALNDHQWTWAVWGNPELRGRWLDV